MNKPEVTHITQIEKSADLVKLVGPHFQHPKLEIVTADIWEWLPKRGTRFDVIYFDIWPDFNTDHLKEMTTLQKKFRRYLAPGGFMDCWSRRELQLLKRRGY